MSFGDSDLCLAQGLNSPVSQPKPALENKGHRCQEQQTKDRRSGRRGIGPLVGPGIEERQRPGRVREGHAAPGSPQADSRWGLPPLAVLGHLLYAVSEL
jgi:hypothetical protein